MRVNTLAPWIHQISLRHGHMGWHQRLPKDRSQSCWWPQY